MESYGVEIDIKFESARQRCRALIEQAKKLATQQYSSRGADVLREFVMSSSERLLELLDAECANREILLLEPDERETRVHRLCKLVPFLYEVLGILSGAEINQTPAELVPPVRRFLRRVLPQAEVLLRCEPSLNYSIVEIADSIRQFFSETPLSSVSQQLPAALYLMSVPSTEANEVLLHAILAHEAGHGIYQQQGLADKILPNVEVPKERIQELARAITSQQETAAEREGSPMAFPFREIALRDLLTQMVTGTISSWIAELACDMLGLLIFGPAYFFAFINLSSTVTMLDEGSHSHPPPRRRIRLMCYNLRQRFNLGEVHPKIDAVLRDWESVAQKETSDHLRMESSLSLALDSLSPKVENLIAQVACDAVRVELLYSQQQLIEDSANIVPVSGRKYPSG